MDQAKLAKMQQSVRIAPILTEFSSPHFNSGKGTPRRKQKKVHKTSGTDDKKLQTSLKKLNVQPIQAIEEVNMFKEDGNVIHFAAPKGTVLIGIFLYSPFYILSPLPPPSNHHSLTFPPSNPSPYKST
ncbi:MAG: hypothetical protein L6R36_005807 [Xanthoria steineri]|nr:MAG: hypothetical protein L6R36_005807 [Xanthoria steineri]